MKSVQFAVKLTFKESVLGTVPYNKELVQRFLQETARDRQLVAPSTLTEELETVPAASLEEMEERAWCGFHADESGPFVHDYLIKGFIKEAANVLGASQLGVKGFRQKTDRTLFLFPRCVHFHRPDGQIISKPDDYLERPIRAMTRQGQIVSLKRSDRIDPPAWLEFTATVITPSEFAKNDAEAEERLRFLLDYGQYKGLGEFRNGGYGSFTYEMTQL